MTKYPMKFWAYMAVCFINSMAQMITIFISLFLHKHHITVNSIGFLVGLFGAGGVVGGYLGGLISDRLSPIYVARLSCLANAVTIIFFPLSHSLWLIGIDLFFMGFFNSFFRPASLLLMLTFTSVGNPGTLMSYRRVFVNLGTSVGVMLSGILFDYNEMLVFICSAGLVMLALVILLFLNINADPHEHELNEQKQKESTSWELYLVLIFLVCGLIVYTQQETVYGIYLKDYIHINGIQLSLLFALNGILVIAFQIPLTHALRGFSPYTLSAVGALLVGLGFGLVIFNYGYLIAIFSVLLWSFGELLLFPSSFELMLKLSMSKSGKSMGLYQTAFAVSSFVGPPLGSVIYEADVFATWWMCIAVGVVSFCGFLILWRKRT